MQINFQGKSIVWFLEDQEIDLKFIKFIRNTQPSALIRILENNINSQYANAFFVNFGQVWSNLVSG